MQKVLKDLIGKRFSVLIDGEFERMTGFLGLMKLLADYSDFYDTDFESQRVYLRRSFREGVFYIDSQISVKFNKGKVKHAK
jgi:hypothetical protein